MKAIVIALLALSAWASAWADVGVSPAKIVLSNPVLPGKDYRLPPLTIVNTGHEPATYEMLVVNNEAYSGAPSTWWAFSPSTIALAPSESGAIAVSLRVPTDARPGPAGAILVARPTAAGTLTSAAGATVRLEVAPSTQVLALARRLEPYLAPLWLLLAVGVLAFAIRWLSRYLVIGWRR